MVGAVFFSVWLRKEREELYLCGHVANLQKQFEKLQHNFLPLSNYQGTQTLTEMPTPCTEQSESKQQGSGCILYSGDSLSVRNVFTESGPEEPLSSLELPTVCSNRRRNKNFVKQKPDFLLTSSVFGIDGSSPPLVCSWSYKPVRKKCSNCKDSCLEHRSCSRHSFTSSLPEVQSPKWGFTSPAFHCKKTSPRTSQHERARSQNARRCRVEGTTPDMTIQRASLFRRPQKDIVPEKIDGVSKDVFAMTHSCPTSPIKLDAVYNTSKLVVLDPKTHELVKFSGAAQNPSHLWTIQSHVVSELGMDKDGSSLLPDKAKAHETCAKDEHNVSSVRKIIDIKLPCLPWN